uniref:Uncharacterized protein n=1 Tax=Anguilla anguilla TaxID=7936 RepID=A0A0E9XQJ8_ANGAN
MRMPSSVTPSSYTGKLGFVSFFIGRLLSLPFCATWAFCVRDFPSFRLYSPILVFL